MQVYDAAICGVTRAEILYGTLGPKHRTKLINSLNSLRNVATPETIWDVVGDNLATLRARGITAPFPDVVIATIGIDLDVELWTRDKQFSLIQQVLPALQLFQEPP